MYCIDCGQRQPPLNAQARYCPFCGATLHRPALVPSSASAPADDPAGTPAGEPASTPAAPQLGSGPSAHSTADGASHPPISTPADTAHDPSTDSAPIPPQGPLNSPLAATLDPKRWVPLSAESTIRRLRTWRRAALASIAALGVAASALAAWWWWDAARKAQADDIPVEQLQDSQAPQAPHSANASKASNPPNPSNAPTTTQGAPATEPPASSVKRR